MGASRGFGFLYMRNAAGARAVAYFSEENKNMISMLGRDNVHLSKHSEEKAAQGRANSGAAYHHNQRRQQIQQPESNSPCGGRAKTFPTWGK